MGSTMELCPTYFGHEVAYPKSNDPLQFIALIPGLLESSKKAASCNKRENK